MPSLYYPFITLFSFVGWFLRHPTILPHTEVMG